MNIAGLSLDQTPPLSVPAPYLVTAPLFAVAAGIAIVFMPEAAANRWFPQTLAVTHLLTLGFLALAMMGAFQQLLPVLAGSPIPRARVTASLIYVPFVAGVILLASGLGSSSPWAMRLASGLLGFAVLLFLSVGAWSLWRAGARSPSVIAMRVALACLLTTAALGLYLAGGHGGGMRLAREFTDFHAVWGLAGWVALLVMGVAYQVVPMFQVTPDYPPVIAKRLVPAIFLSLVVWSATAGWFPRFAHVAAIPIAAGLACFGVATLWIQYRRRRRLPDVTLDFWRAGMACLLLGVVLWGVFAALQRPVPPIPLGVLFIIGFGMSVVSGMLYKILPFLIWLHLNNKLFMAAGMRGRVPNMKQVIPETRARIQFRLHVAALLLLFIAALTSEALLARAAGGMFAISSAMLVFNLLSALALYGRILREASAGLKKGAG